MNPLPIMCMVVGLACGASVGVYARANGWLSARTNIYVEEWKETGLSAKDITTRVFDSIYPPPEPAATPVQEPTDINPPGDREVSTVPSTPGAAKSTRKREKGTTLSTPVTKHEVSAERQSSHRDTILFTASLQECMRLRNAEDEDELRREMASGSNNRLANLARSCKSYECLQREVDRACAKYK
jgi:hypothetical protein